MLRTLYERDRLLTLTAAGMVAALMLVALVAPFDTRTITGINPWIKPMKFLVSIAIFLATMAWFMPEVDASARARRRLSITFAGAMIIEIICIAAQAFRGTTSHFNYTTPLDATVFQIMGVAITVNTAAAAVMLWLLRRDASPSRAGYMLGMRLGLTLFVIGSVQGFVMVGNQGHAVPGPDGGAGLPFVNWSIDQGDLRIAHFIGLHALQALPLLGYMLDVSGALTTTSRRAALSGVAIVWLAIMSITLSLALQGQSLLGQ